MRLPGIGEAVGYVEGFRAWRISVVDWKSTELRLRSVTADINWQPDEAMTACCVDGRCGACEKKRIAAGMSDPDRSILRRWGLGHGIYAKKSFDGIIDSHYVYGTVALWGKVAHHTKGYRGTRAYPKCLYKWPGQEDIEELAEIYGCGVEPPCDELMMAYREYAHSSSDHPLMKGIRANPLFQHGLGMVGQAQVHQKALSAMQAQALSAMGRYSKICHY